MNAIRFIPVASLNEPMTITLGLSGASGTGKTYSALRIARGIAEAATGKKGAPIGFIDTENRRALHYAEEFPELVHYDMRAVDEKDQMIGFGPERWIEVLDAAEKQGLSVLVIDSFSHEWEGVGGVLELHQRVLDRLTGGNDELRDKRSQLAWADVKPRHRRLVDRIVRAKTHIIICTRAKPVMQDPRTRRNARKTKTRIETIPWDIAGDGDLLFEMTAMFMLDPSAPGRPVHRIKAADQVKPIFDPDRVLDERTGHALVEWSKRAGDATANKRLLDAARDVARKGTEAFRDWWKAQPPTTRAACQSIIDELKEDAKKADARALANDDDPFAGDEEEDPTATLTPEQIEAAMAEAERKFREEQEKQQ